MKIHYKTVIITLGILVIGVASASAQSSSSEEQPNRLSVGLLGGITIGHMNIGTEYDPTFGFNLRYAANPVLAVQANFGFGTFTSSDEDGFQDNGNYYDRHFENSYVTTSLTSQINLLRLLGGQSERVSIYGNVGLGLIFNDVTTELNNPTGGYENFIGEDHTETAMYAVFGSGVRFNVAHRIDLFAQYDYHIPNSDIIDGHRTRPEMDIDLHRRNPDPWSSITAGLQIKFGGSDKDADWHYMSPGVTKDEFDRLAQRVGALEDNVADNTARLDGQDQRIDDLEQALNDRMDELERRLDDVEHRLSELERVDLTFGSDVLFALDSAVIQNTAKPDLIRIARALQENTDRNVTIVGHTCDLGTAEYNQGLSERRAAAVKEFLVTAGIDENRIQTEGRGLTEPIVPNENEQARQLNRRVELSIE